MDIQKTLAAAGGLAFPSSFKVNDVEYHQLGMSMRDYFAAQAMSQGMATLTAHQQNLNSYQLVTLATIAYEAADAMLKVREQ